MNSTRFPHMPIALFIKDRPSPFSVTSCLFSVFRQLAISYRFFHSSFHPSLSSCIHVLYISYPSHWFILHRIHIPPFSLIVSALSPLDMFDVSLSFDCLPPTQPSQITCRWSAAIFWCSQETVGLFIYLGYVWCESVVHITSHS